MAGNVLSEEKVKRLACATFEHGSIVAASKALGISARHARRLAATPYFTAALSAARSAALQDVASRLTSAGRKAVDALIGLMDGEVADGVKCRAALGVLSSVISLSEFATLESRIRALEEQSHVEQNTITH